MLDPLSRTVVENQDSLLSYSVSKLVANMEEVEAPILINLIK